MDKELYLKGNISDCISNSIFEGIAILDKQLNIVEINQWIQNIKKDEKIIGSKCYKIFKKQENECVDCPVLRTFETGKPCKEILHDPFIENTKNYYEITTYPIYNDSGNIDYVMQKYNDISHFKKIENDLTQSEELFKAAFYTSPDAVNITTIAGEYVEVNQGFTRLTGFTEKDAVGKLSSEINIWEIPEDREKLIKGLMKYGIVENLESIFKMKNGKLIPGLMSAKIIMWNNEPHILSVTRDITLKKEHEQKIEELEKLYSKMVNHINDVIVIMDENFIIKYKSPNISEHFGWDPEDLIGKHGLVNIHPDDLHIAKQNIKEMNHNRNVRINIDVRYKCKDGQFKYIHFSGINLVDDPIIKGYLGNYHDITDKIIREERLLIAKKQAEESEKNFRTLHDVAFAGLAIHDKGIIVECNNALCELFGYEKDELIGMNCFNIINKEYHDVVNSNISKEFAEPYLVRAKKSNGQDFFCNISGRFISFKGKKHRVAEFRDVSKEIEFESKLKDSEEKFRTIAEQSNDLIAIADFNGIITYVSPASQDILGYKPNEGIGRNFIEFFTSESKESALHNFQKTMNIPGYNTKEEYQIIKKDGNKITIEINSKRIDTNSLSGVLAIIRDITERKKYEENLIEAKRKAEESNKLKSAFLMNMSHEIRTPMNGVLGFLNLLAEPNLTDEDKADYINIMNKSGERLLNTINDIIELSKIESGELEANIEPMNIANLMQYYQETFSVLASEKGLSFSINEQIIGDKAAILSDSSLIDGIMINLIKNAVKFTEEGFVQIGNYINESNLLFYVKDSGRGIPSDKLDIIFERFVQADYNIDRPYEGSGLGLSICKSYAEALKGKIEVISTPDVGSTFIFSMPYIPFHEKIKDKVEILQEPSVPKSYNKILIVEDDATNTYLIKKILNDYQHQLYADSAIKAIELFDNHPDINLILLDIKLPGKYNGFDVAKWIRERNVKVPIIAQTAFADEEAKNLAINCGCNDVIAKPFTKTSLLKIIEKYLH